MVILWECPLVPDQLWKRLVQVGRQRDQLVELGTVILSARLIGHVGVEQGDSSSRWHMSLGPRPASHPPAGVEELTTAIGGAEGLRALVLEGWESGMSPPADFRISASLLAKDWTCVALHQAPLPVEPASRLDSQAKLEQIGYRLSGPLGISEVAIIYYHDTEKYYFRCHARGVMELAEDFQMPYVESVIKLTVDTFFRRRHA